MLIKDGLVVTKKKKSKKKKDFVTIARKNQ